GSESMYCSALTYHQYPTVNARNRLGPRSCSERLERAREINLTGWLKLAAFRLHADRKFLDLAHIPDPADHDPTLITGIRPEDGCADGSIENRPQLIRLAGRKRRHVEGIEEGFLAGGVEQQESSRGLRLVGARQGDDLDVWHAKERGHLVPGGRSLLRPAGLLLLLCQTLAKLSKFGFASHERVARRAELVYEV